ncbi:MAG: hypothetical protein COU27_01250 [Candidatus Levybacteria bacterium CG10_big_fil_rev_8_21_14_0_10_36_7]|nr:MAG: hypothetical protein COU27_01250 [Candidatus Levybacteria bacterium CG10_big_fil_rev_8_21_14_0_10_36_7]
MKILKEIAIPTILIVALILLANPYMFWMPSPMQMLILVVFVITFVLFGSFIWKEKAADERENLHRYIIGRFAFLTVTTILVFGIILQTINHSLDIWLVITLISGILAKVAGRYYAQKKL